MTGEENTNNMGAFGTISVEAFKEALDRVYRAGMSRSYLKMIKAQHRAPHATITATELALAAGFKDYRGANLQYGGGVQNLALQPFLVIVKLPTIPHEISIAGIGEDLPSGVYPILKG